MTRPRKPTAVLELCGAFKKDPKRGAARADEPKPVGEIGDPPDGLTEAVREAWIELRSLAHAGTLSPADGPFLLYAAKVWAQVKAADFVDPKLGVRFESILGRLGMTPADRSRVAALKPKAAVPESWLKFKPAT